MNTEEAREYFKPLTYEDLTEKNFNKLVAILEEVLGAWNRQVLEEREEHGHDNKYYMTIYPHKKYGKYAGTRFVEKNGVKEAFIIVECDRYSIREGISFNKDGFIGFAGWSDSTNVVPFITAFKTWVDKIKIERKIIPIKTSLALKPEQVFGMTLEQYDTYINSYYVNQLPENPDLGRLVCMDNVEYIYTDVGWCKTQRNQDKLTKIKDIVKNMEDCPTKMQLLQALI